VLIGRRAVLSTIILDALGTTYKQMAVDLGIDPALMHRTAVLAAGTLDSLPHNGGVIALLAVCGSTHRESDVDIAMVVGVVLGLGVVIALGPPNSSTSPIVVDQTVWTKHKHPRPTMVT